MINQTSFDIIAINGPVHLTITPVIQPLPGGNYYATCVYRLNDGVVGMGTITFDEDMNNWSYDGIDQLTYDEAAEVAGFIKIIKIRQTQILICYNS
jgi:hypothetical protein